jgi:hypothetical protein
MQRHGWSGFVASIQPGKGRNVEAVIELPSRLNHLEVLFCRKAGLSYGYVIFRFLRTTPGRPTMSFPYTPNLKDEKLESLQTQYDFLKLLRLRHLQWMNLADDSQVEGLHLEIAELLEQITDRYHDLLDGLQQSDSEGYP